MTARTIKSQRGLPTTAADPRRRRVARGRGRLRAAVEQLPPETIEAIAQRVAQLLFEQRASVPRLVDAEQLAGQFGLTRAWVYQHAHELGAIRLGQGPKARLRFNPTIAAEALANRDRPGEPSPPPSSTGPRGRPRRLPVPSDELLPIRSRAISPWIRPGATSPSE